MNDNVDYGKNKRIVVTINEERWCCTRYTTAQVIRVPNANEVEVGSSELPVVRWIILRL